MDDLIERSRAISAVNWHSHRCDCIEEIRRIPAVNCLISVDNALPNTDGEYIVYTDHYEIVEYNTKLHQFGHTDEYKDELGYNIVEWYEVHGVTYWMPLPEQPEKE